MPTTTMRWAMCSLGSNSAIGVVVGREGGHRDDADAHDDHQQADGDDGWMPPQLAGDVPEQRLYR